MSTNNVDNSLDLYLIRYPKSRFSESIKSIRTNLAFSNVDKRKKVILMTSCEPGDGKSFIAANLAAAYAQEGKKVLMIDCDLRRGRQHKIFGVHNSANAGYSRLILEYNENYDIDIKQRYVLRTNVENIFLIPSGPIPPNPTELLTSNNNEKLLRYLTNEYDIVILDCTPIIGLSDAAIMTKYSDINLLVVSNNKTKIELVERAKKAFAVAKADITGVILNKIPNTNLRYNSYYSYK